jgi:hypothetical protein
MTGIGANSYPSLGSNYLHSGLSYKRLEEGTYAMPFSESGEVRQEITAQELGALLSGIDLRQAKRRKRYRRTVSEAA